MLAGKDQLIQPSQAAHSVLLAEGQVRLNLPWQKLLTAELNALWGTSSEKSVLG